MIYTASQKSQSCSCSVYKYFLFIAAQSQTTRSLDISENLSQSSEGLGEAAEGLSINEDEEPRKRGPGRKKRTEWVYVETEEGEKKWVSPQEYRKLRR